jgi:prepilin-type N-terminal cleavage/methylation domain-containing protein
MKQKAFTLVELLVVISLVALVVSIVLTAISNSRSGYRVDGVRVMVIDNCEYFVSYAAGGEVLAHKGNCTNSIHSVKPE